MLTSHTVSMTLLLLCILCFCLSSAEAKIVPITFTGEVTYVSENLNSLEGRINVGDMITGIYIYDSSTPDSDTSLYRGLYEYSLPPCGITLTIGGFVFMTDPDSIEFYVEVRNDWITINNSYDACIFGSGENLSLSNDVGVRYIELAFWDYSTGVLSSDALSTTAPVLDDWLTKLVISGWDSSIPDRGLFYVLEGHLTSAVLVPEPATFLMMGFGGLVLLRKHRR